MVTIVFPEAAMRFTVWKTPRCCCPGYMPMVSADCAAVPWPGAWFAGWLAASGPNFGPWPVSRARARTATATSTITGTAMAAVRRLTRRRRAPGRQVPGSSGSRSRVSIPL